MDIIIKKMIKAGCFMEILILIAIVIGCVWFFNSWTFQSWFRGQQAEQERENIALEKEIKEKELYDKGFLFYESIIENDAIKAMANKLLTVIRGMMTAEIYGAHKNITQNDIRLKITYYGIFKLEYSYQYKCYVIDYADKSGLSLSFADYGIQMSNEPYKEYGLALALETLISSQKSSFPAEVKDFEIHANIIETIFENSFETTLSLSWTIKLNKFVEL